MPYSNVQYCYEDNTFRKKLFSPLKIRGFVPEKGSEIFVSNIPKYASLDDLCRFFEPVGEIFQINLMMKSNCTYNRGFAYVTYMNKQLARDAIRKLNDQPFMNGDYLTIQKSVDNCRIFIGGLPITRTKDEIWHELRTVYKITNLVDVITYRSYANPTYNLGFVFLEFRTHEDASYFRAKYWDKLRLFGKQVMVAWSIPTMEMENEDLLQYKILFIRNLDVTQTSEKFGKMIYELTEKKNVEKIYKFKDYAYVHLVSREEAEKLMVKLTDHFQWSVVEVMFAKPPNKFTDQEFRDKALLSRRTLVRQWNNNNASCLTPSPLSPSITSSEPSLAPSASARQEDLESQLSSITLQCMEAENKLRDLQLHREVLRTRLSTSTSDYSSSSSAQSWESFPNVSYCHDNLSLGPDFTFMQQYQPQFELPLSMGYRRTGAYPGQFVPDNAVDLEVKILFIRNLDVTQTSEKFGKMIYELTEKKNVEKIYKFKDYAYVHLVSREEAEKLMVKLTDHFQWSVVEVMFAKPPNKFTDQEFRDKALLSRRTLVRQWINNNASCLTPSPLSPSITSSEPSLAPSASARQEDLESQLSSITLQCMEAENKLRDLQLHREVLRTRLSTSTSDYSSSSAQSWESFPNVSYCHDNLSLGPDFTFMQQYQPQFELPLSMGYRRTGAYPGQFVPDNAVDLENMVNNLVNDP